MANHDNLASTESLNRTHISNNQMSQIFHSIGQIIYKNRFITGGEIWDYVRESFNNSLPVGGGKGKKSSDQLKEKFYRLVKSKPPRIRIGEYGGGLSQQEHMRQKALKLDKSIKNMHLHSLTCTTTSSIFDGCSCNQILDRESASPQSPFTSESDDAQSGNDNEAGISNEPRLVSKTDGGDLACTGDATGSGDEFEKGYECSGEDEANGRDKAPEGGSSSGRYASNRGHGTGRGDVTLSLIN